MRAFFEAIGVFLSFIIFIIVFMLLIYWSAHAEGWDTESEDLATWFEYMYCYFPPGGA